MRAGTRLQIVTLLAVWVLPLSLGGCHGTSVEQDVASKALRESLYGLSPVEYQGKKLYEHYCVICHGAQGRGDGFNAYTLKPPPADLAAIVAQGDDAGMLKVIDGGSVAIGKSPLCPPRKGAVTPEDQKSLVSYIHRLAVKP